MRQVNLHFHEKWRGEIVKLPRSQGAQYGKEPDKCVSE